MGDWKMEVQVLYNGYWDHNFLTDSISAEFPLEYSSHLLFSDFWYWVIVFIKDRKNGSSALN